MQVNLRHKIWYKCSRCGQDFPMDMLTSQLGLMVCHANGCWDNLDTLYRPRIIDEVLSEPKEADDNLAQRDRFDEPGELLEL